MSLDGINGWSIQMLLKGENSSRQLDEIQARFCEAKERTLGCSWPRLTTEISRFSISVQSNYSYVLEIELTDNGFLIHQTSMSDFHVHLPLTIE